MIRHLRIMEYIFPSLDARNQHMRHQSVPANGSKAFGSACVINSVTLEPEEYTLTSDAIRALQENGEIVKLARDFGVEAGTALQAVRELVRKGSSPPEYVYKMIDAIVAGKPLDFEGVPVPAAVQGYLAGKIHASERDKE